MDRGGWWRGRVLSAVLSVAMMAGASACGEDDDAKSTPSEEEDEHPDRGDLEVSFEGMPSDPISRQLAEGLEEEGAYDDLVEAFNETFKLPRDLPIEHVECGEANAFYDPQQRKLFMCYELLQTIVQVAQDPSLDEDERTDMIGGTWMFVLFHELGHALIDFYDLPVTGREEDAVDDFSAVLMIDSGNPTYALAAAAFFEATDSGMYDKLSFADEHSLGAQRVYSILCTVYGSDPDRYESFVTSGLLPESRAVRCPAEYQQKSNAWEALLEPWMK